MVPLVISGTGVGSWFESANTSSGAEYIAPILLPEVSYRRNGTLAIAIRR